MSGIGILLILMQIPPFLGATTPSGGTMGILKALPGMLSSVSFPELGLGVLALAILFGFPASWRKKCPAQLVALVAATLVSLLLLDGME